MKLLSIKDIAKELDVSESTAKRYNMDIKKHYGIPHKITKMHLIDYFKIPKC